MWRAFFPSVDIFLALVIALSNWLRAGGRNFPAVGAWFPGDPLTLGSWGHLGFTVWKTELLGLAGSDHPREVEVVGILSSQLRAGICQCLHKSFFALRRWDLREDRGVGVWEGKGRRLGEKEEVWVVEGTGWVRGSEALPFPYPPTHSTRRLRTPRSRTAPKTERSRILASQRS